MKSYYKGKFIVIEGADATGKTTQVNLLQKYLESNGFHIKLLDFPRYYNNFWGKMVGAYLRGKFGDLYENNPYLSTLPYILDQAEARYQIKYALKKGKLVLSNRYITSNIHQCVKLPYYDRPQYLNWLEEAAYKRLKAVKPDLVIVLHVPAEDSQEMNKNKADRNYLNGQTEDIAEKDIKHQKVAREEYYKQAKRRNNWILINCKTSNRKLKSPEKIHEQIVDKLTDMGFFDDVTHPQQMLLPNLS
jgi:dTMP kinase